MKVGIAALTDTQRLVLASGKALAEELRLTQPSYLLHMNDIEFTEGQIALVATPHGITVGLIKVEVKEYFNKHRYTEYTLNDAILFKKSERLRDGKWVPIFSPDLRIPENSTLYLS